MYSRVLSVVFLLMMMPCVQALDFAFISDSKFRSCLQKMAIKKQWLDLNAAQEIKCHSLGIQSLDGINRLHELKQLSVYNNQIASLPELKLPKLSVLNLARNQLASLNLSHLPRLERVFFFDNIIEHVTLKDLPLLEQLKGSNNQIRNFQYEGLVALQKMYLYDNEMEHIDIHRLPALKYMDVRQNPMPDELYEEMDKMNGVTFLHEGNAEDWQ